MKRNLFSSSLSCRRFLLLRFNSFMYFLFLFFFYNNVFLFFFFFPFIIPLLSSLTQIKFSFLLDLFFILFLSLFISIACTFNAIKEKNYIKYLFYFLTFTFFFNSFVLFSLHFSLFFLCLSVSLFESFFVILFRLWNCSITFLSLIAFISFSVWILPFLKYFHSFLNISFFSFSFLIFSVFISFIFRFAFILFEFLLF